MAVLLHRRDSFLVLGHEVDGLEPHREGQLGGVEVVPAVMEVWRWQRLHCWSLRLLNWQHWSWPQ